MTSIQDQIAAIKAKHREQKKRRPWWKRSIGALKGAYHSLNNLQNERHHPSAKYKNAAKNTHRNPANVRGSKSKRPSGHHAKHYAFKYRFGL